MAGGFVSCSRVNGNLALSRALGDFGFKANGDLGPKDQVVTGEGDFLQTSFCCSLALMEKKHIRTLFFTI